ncbi:MAG: SCP2 sterol-binding domain-containing protein [Actinobacteria bacterium]|nr:SCP2 sterol-binding domain-containing protein [Actinomycetota bacterium]
MRRARTRSGSSAGCPSTTLSSRPSSTSASGSITAAPRCSRTAPRSIRKGIGCGCPTTSSARCSPGTSTSSPGPSSATRLPAILRTTCLQAFEPVRPCAHDDERCWLDVTKYLTQEWLDEARELAKDQPERAGASATIQYVVSGGPDGDVKYYWVLENGKLLKSQLGDIAEPEITMSLSYDDSVSVQNGELDPNAAFMQGRMKVSGNMGKLMQLLPLTMSPEYKALQEEIRKITEY